MPALSIATFFNGAATAWFAVNACQLLARRHRTRLQSLLAFIFVYWAVMTAKDLVSLMPGAYNGPMLDTIQMLDGLGVVVLTCLLFELSMPRWVTARRVALLTDLYRNIAFENPHMFEIIAGAEETLCAGFSHFRNLSTGANP